MENLYDQTSYKKVIFAAMSKRNFFLREHIIRFILKQGFTPTCAFMMYSYFLLDTVERDALISANNALIERSDELWVFGDISDGVQEEIKLAKRLNQPIKYFSTCITPSCEFKEISEAEAVVENHC
ncbi:MAG: hypothetical protein ACD_22C00221G0006 [uncultured bacterium]|nr:MAG: hypothetical protein ACD_22C00221G0006 [uncultured bacterium]